MLRNNHILSFLSAVLILLAGCKSSKPSRPAKLQLISMVPGVQATLTTSPLHAPQKEESHTLGYASPSGYLTFNPGRYKITYAVDGKTILDHTFVLGKNSRQSLLVAGMMDKSLQSNPQTTLFTIRNILAGSENDDTNGYMPQYLMLRDQFKGSKKNGLIRLINLSPFARPVTIHRGQKERLHADYLHETEPLETKPGMHQLQFFMDHILLTQKSLSIKEGYMHTIITGNGNSGHSLTTVSYDSPTSVTSS